MIAQGRVGEIPVMEVKDGEVLEEPKGEEIERGEVRPKPWEKSGEGKE